MRLRLCFLDLLLPEKLRLQDKPRDGEITWSFHPHMCALCPAVWTGWEGGGYTQSDRGDRLIKDQLPEGRGLGCVDTHSMCSINIYWSNQQGNRQSCPCRLFHCTLLLSPTILHYPKETLAVSLCPASRLLHTLFPLLGAHSAYRDRTEPGTKQGHTKYLMSELMNE